MNAELRMHFNMHHLNTLMQLVCTLAVVCCFLWMGYTHKWQLHRNMEKPLVTSIATYNPLTYT